MAVQLPLAVIRKKLDVVSAFEAWGEKVSGKISDEDYDNVISKSCPGPELVEECILQTQWHQQLKLWVCLYHLIRQIQL